VPDLMQSTLQPKTIASVSRTSVKLTRYVSPVYIAKYASTTPGDCDRHGMIHFNQVEEDNFLEWLANNSLCVLRDPLPERVDGHSGYLFQTQNSSCLVNVEHHEVNPIAPLFRATQDKHYVRNVTIRSQPVGFQLGTDLLTALNDRNYKEVQEF
jgi:hypothetical protein